MSGDKRLPRISVVTPSLNQGRYLRQCIESILSQGYGNLELLIIDGGSTDESLAVMKEYESAIAYGVSEPDAGQSDAINKGFAKATGEIVAWLNADDFYLPGALDRVAEAYAADPGAPFYFGDGLRVDQAGTPLSNFFPPESLRFDRQALVMGLNYILQPSTFINRRSLEQVGYLDASLHYGMDSDIWMRLSAVGTPRAIPVALSATREYGTTKTASGSFKRVEELRQISMKHSGLPITPGVLCYLLDTLVRFAQQKQDVFPPSYLGDVTRFWYQTQQLLQAYDAFPDGFPRAGGRQVPGGELDNPIKSAIDQIETLTGWMREAHAARAELRGAMDSRKASHDLQVKEMNRLNADAASQIEALTGWMREALEGGAALRNAIDQSHAAQAGQAAALHEAHADAARRMEALQASMLEARRSNAALQHEIDEQRKAYDAQVAQIEELNLTAAARFDAITGRAREARRENAALRKELDAQGSAHAARMADLNAVSASISSQVEQLTQWMREAREAEAALRQAMREQVDAHAREVGALESRLARPLVRLALRLSGSPGRLDQRASEGERR